MDIETWASAYIAFQQDGAGTNENHPLWWAVKRFMDAPGSDESWSTILAILGKNPPDSVIGVLAAGPLEDLIQDSGLDYIERIELEARRNPAFRHLLGGVWKSGTPEVWARLEVARSSTW
ncbi:hypothetical protein VC279_00570 [Xanthomonas sp. WHRI 10064A]|uniref:DUF6869 domain-containing protein n=1 Tax=unclassified Xanthomonas TaxID=2643310 RepID=UPI002B22236C|nr:MULTISPECIES: hypothetical protein [unclassified Xanthomonas]MEA9588297.1 hypothetical protein [Xanthomonas sp. WHRI 10064B]MEA9613283.1 hypothetical protein [Xanthomonas sp. WHRI 10064A]